MEKFNKTLILNFLKFIRRITSLSRFERRLILVVLDLFIINICLFSTGYFYSNIIIYGLFFASSVSVLVYFFTGQYKSLTYYFDISSLYSILARNILIVILLNFYRWHLGGQFLSFNFNITFYSSISLLILLSRLILRDLFRMSIKKSRINLGSVAIYGAGAAGAQLEAALKISGKYKVKAFIDESPKLWGRYINGIRIYSPKFLSNKTSVDKILFAIPSLSKEQKKVIFSDLNKTGIPIFQIPSIEEISLGKSSIDKLKPIEINDLLSRDVVQPNNNLLLNAIKGYSVCITGAAGSIGSELSRQIISLKPKKIILIDNTEHNLYLLREELNSLIKKKVDIHFILGDVVNIDFVKNIFSLYKIDIVFHAAAYKHVPLVESNPISGIKNNVFSTKVICEVSLLLGIKKVILISSDKAVRPTNIMGTSKRLSEMIIQSFAQEVEENNKKYKVKTKFAMVRFGNVLDSSGSVVPLFRKQIAQGGPITITHPKVIRYFMTIDEASQLVLQASAMAKGGDVFLLDMGEPVYIYDLAKQMIKLSGYELKDSKNPKGDIEIINIGLRPGEKLYEELLINAEALPTKHPLIYRAKEEFIAKDELNSYLRQLKELVSSGINEKKLNILLKKIVPEWKGTINISEN